MDLMNECLKLHLESALKAFFKIVSKQAGDCSDVKKIKALYQCTERSSAAFSIVITISFIRFVVK